MAIRTRSCSRCGGLGKIVTLGLYKSGADFVTATVQAPCPECGGKGEVTVEVVYG